MIALAGRVGLRLGLFLTLAWALLCAPALAADGPTFPDLNGRRVVDEAHVLSPDAQADLTAKLAALEAKTSRQLVVVTLPTLGGYEIADYGVQLLRHWGIGQKGINNGVVFIVVPTEHKVRIEVGYGMEGVLTDALSSVILQRAAIPKFKTGDVQGGVVDATSALVEQMSLDPTAAEARIAAAEQGAAAAPMRRGHGSPLGGILPIILIIFIISSIFRRRRHGYGGGGFGWLLPFMFLGGGRGGGWGGGGDWGGGGGGGGGFSGGGGSGGGGGASGSW